MQTDFADSSLFPYDADDGTRAQGASITIDPKTGGVTALVGGRNDSHVFRGYNRATQLVRSPGSTIKPLAVYARLFSMAIIMIRWLKTSIRLMVQINTVLRMRRGRIKAKSCFIRLWPKVKIRLQYGC